MIMERRGEREAAWLGQLRKSKHTNSLSARKMRGEDRSRLHLKSSVAAVVELARRARKKKKWKEKKRKEEKRREKGRSGDKTGERKPVGKRVLSSWIGDGEGPRI